MQLHFFLGSLLFTVALGKPQGSTTSAPASSTSASADSTTAALPACCKIWGSGFCGVADIDVNALAQGTLKEVGVPGHARVPFLSKSEDGANTFQIMEQAVLNYIPETKTVQGLIFGFGPQEQTFSLESCDGKGYIWRGVPTDQTENQTSTTTTSRPAADSPACCQQWLQQGVGVCTSADIDVDALARGEPKEVRFPGNVVVPFQSKSGDDYIFQTSVEATLNYYEKRVIGSAVDSQKLYNLEPCNGDGYIWRSVELGTPPPN